MHTVMLLMKQKEPPTPEQAPAVIEARRELEKAIANQEKVRAKRDALRRTLADPVAPPADKVRARLALAGAEAAAEIAEIEANEKQNIESSRLQEARQVLRPGFEERYAAALKTLYAGLESIMPLNEAAREAWAAANAAGFTFTAGFWPEFLSDNGGGETLLQFRRRLLQNEKWI